MNPAKTVKPVLSTSTKAKLREHYNAMRFETPPPFTPVIASNATEAMAEMERKSRDWHNSHYDRLNGFCEAVDVVMGITRNEARDWLEK